MKPIRLILSLTLLAALAAAEEPAKPAAPAPKLEALIIPVKTLSGDSFDRLFRLLGVFGVRMQAESKLRTILVYGTKEENEQVRRTVEALDKPGSEAAIGRNIEASLTFLRCSVKPFPDARPLTPELEAVARQLRAVTQFKEFQLWDIIPVHLQEGRTTDQSSRLPSLNADLPAVATAQIKLVPESVQRRDNSRFVRFDRLSIGLRLPYRTGSGQSFQFLDAGLTTAGDFKEGQKSVIGKVSGIDDESAVFVVVSLKVLD